MPKKCKSLEIIETIKSRVKILQKYLKVLKIDQKSRKNVGKEVSTGSAPQLEYGKPDLLPIGQLL